MIDLEKNYECTTIALRTAVTDRNWTAYEKLLAINPEKLGTHSLDLGAGRRLKYARMAKRKGIEVISINPRLITSDQRQQVASHPENKTLKKCAAIAESLPFADNTFDSVTACYSVPYYTNPSDFFLITMEISRVLKSGRSAFIYPRRERTGADIVDCLEYADIPFSIDGDLVVITKPSRTWIYLPEYPLQQDLPKEPILHMK